MKQGKRYASLVKGGIRLAAVSLAAVLFSSCGLLPKEEEYEAAPLVREYEAGEYAYVTVTKEDLQLTKKISCIYSSAEESQLSFETAGEIVQEVYYALGDSVKEGDLLAELSLGTLPSELESLSYQKEELALTLAHTEELLALEKRRMKLAGEEESALASGYERQLEEGVSELALLEDKLTSVRQKLASRRIVAPADGSITYIKNDLKGSTSRSGEVLIKLVSGEECYFVADVEEAEGLSEGEAVRVVVSSTVYEAVTEFPEEENGSVYFVIDGTAGQPEVGSRGSATLVLDERKAVLCLSNKAIKKVGEDRVVYYEDENGIKSMKYIEVGLVGNQKSEILSGLELGESVIAK